MNDGGGLARGGEAGQESSDQELLRLAYRSLVPVSINPGVEVHRRHRVGRGVGQPGDDMYQVDLRGKGGN